MYYQENILQQIQVIIWWEKRLCTQLFGMQMSMVNKEISMEAPQKLRTELPSTLAIWEGCLKDLTLYLRENCASAFIAAVSTVDKKWNQSRLMSKQRDCRA